MNSLLCVYYSWFKGTFLSKTKIDLPKYLQTLLTVVAVHLSNAHSSVVFLDSSHLSLKCSVFRQGSWEHKLHTHTQTHTHTHILIIYTHNDMGIGKYVRNHLPTPHLMHSTQTYTKNRKCIPIETKRQEEVMCRSLVEIHAIVYSEELVGVRQRALGEYPVTFH